MPGLYHVALARPIIARSWTESGEDYFRQDLVLHVSENYQEHEDGFPNQCSQWRSYIVAGGCYPFWFQEEHKIFQVLNQGAYAAVPPEFFSQKPQVLYIFETCHGFAQFYVHTPELDPPGLYAVFESDKYGRDMAFYGTAEDTFYICHRRFPMQ